MDLRKTLHGLFGWSGGVGYHLAAFAYSGKLWAPFRSQVSSELARFLTSGNEPDLSRVHLVVIGMSGGYCLDAKFLSSFHQVTAVDIDPLAGLILRRRFGRSLHFVGQDFFKALEEAGWSLGQWMEKYIQPTNTSASTIFLFSNLFGQLEYLFTDQRLREVDVGLSKAFRATEFGWLSFHDRLSIPGLGRDIVIRSPARYPSEALANEFLVVPDRGGASLEVEEHELGEWINSARGEFVYLPWRLSSARTQIIELCGAI